jgi:protein tyrosine/serine phosphatase
MHGPPVTARLPRPDPNDLPNFGWVEAWLARGAEPTPAGFKWLRDAAVKTVVNLRAEDDTEAPLDATLGLAHVQVAVNDNAAPTLQQALDWLALCATSANRPIFVHCRSGHGRTSTFCILVRLAQGIALDDAVHEQEKLYGFNADHDPAQVTFLKGVRDLVVTHSLTLPTLT